MTADHLIEILASVVAAVAIVLMVGAVVVLGRRVRDLQEVVVELREETIPLLRDARLAADQAATEMTRVGDVLSSAEAVSATVDSASRLAYRAFSNPVVRTVAFGSGISGAYKRLFGRVQ